jgi:glutamate carboxypeptidase
LRKGRKGFSFVRLPLRSLRILCFLCGAAISATAAQAQLSDTEQRIAAAVKRNAPAALELLEKSVRVGSGTLNPAGVRAVGEIYRAELEALGFETRWADMPAAMKRAGHLVAIHPGKQGRRLLLLGHLDTVFEKSSGEAAWDRRGDKVRGPGVNDMKGGDVALIEALRALDAAGALRDARISVLLTGDEERIGLPIDIARAPLVALARESDYALSFEASTLRAGQVHAIVSRRSSDGWLLRVEARPGHSSAIFSEVPGNGAIFEAARILDAFRAQLAEPGVTFNAGMMVGGTDVRYSPETAGGSAFGKSNVIPRAVTVTGDLRVATPQQAEHVKERMRAIVAASLPGTKASIRFRAGVPPMPETPAGNALLKLYSQASEDAGLGRVLARPPAFAGAGDVQFAAPYATGIDGLGPHGHGAHTDDEELDIASLEQSAIRAAVFLYRLTQAQP